MNLRTRKHALPLALTLGLLTATGSRAQAQAAPLTTPTIPTSQMVMNEAIQRELLRLNDFGLFDDLRFSTKDGKVTLRGHASRPSLKTSAENAVKKVAGVESVTNEIEVLPFNRLDEDVRARAYVAIYGHPSLSLYNPNRGSPVFINSAAAQMGISLDPPIGYHPIHIIVKNQRVILTGVVNRTGDSALAGILVNSLSGVFDVDNQLAVATLSKPVKKAKTAK
jgi:hyperosmotically inducible periplasmic protein